MARESGSVVREAQKDLVAQRLKRKNFVFPLDLAIKLEIASAKFQKTETEIVIKALKTLFKAN